MGGTLPCVEAVFYLDRSGRIAQLPLNAYMPVAFYPSTTTSLAKINRQWLEAGKYLSQALSRWGIKSMVCLPPEITDIRPFQWEGFEAGIRYTFYVDFPFDRTRLDASVKKNINKSSNAGYYCVYGSDKELLEDIIFCLRETENRQNFKYNLTLDDLLLASELMGKESFRTYVAYSSQGEPASARIVLYSPGSRAIDWVAGTADNHLQSGATQLLIKYIFDDLQKEGALGFDFAGANIPSVAFAKANWGGRLVSYYTLRSYNSRELLRVLKQWIMKKKMFVKR